MSGPGSHCIGLEPTLVLGQLRCANCGRLVATYNGVQQHRRGAEPTARSGPTTRQTKAEVIAMLPERMTAFEARLASLYDQLGEVVDALAELTERLDRWVDRQPLVLEVRPTHQRKADNGTGGREELRETRRQLRKVAGE